MCDPRSTIPEVEFMCTLYIYLGIISTMCAILSIVVIASSSDFRSKYVNIIGLNICEIVDATSYILAGYGRRQALENGILFYNTTVYDCFFTKFWPHALILGTELVSYCIILVSCERLLIVCKPHVYRMLLESGSKKRLLVLVPLAGVETKDKQKRTRLFLLIRILPAALIPCYVTISIAAATISAWQDGNRPIETQHCCIVDSTAAWFSTYHFLLISSSFFASFVTFIVVWRKTVNSMRSPSKRLSRRGRITRPYELGIWLAVSGFSSLLVSLPTTLMLLTGWKISTFYDTTVAVVYAMPGVVAIVNTIVIFAYLSEKMRQRLRVITEYLYKRFTHQFWSSAIDWSFTESSNGTNIRSVQPQKNTVGLWIK